MARMLRYVGLFGLAGSACMLLAGELGWIEGELVDAAVLRAVPIGLLCLAAGVLLAVLTPVGRALRHGRCVRCGSLIERGQTYCLDHLQETLNEYRDRAREGSTGGHGG